MSLTGGSFLGLVVALTVMAFLVVVVVWPALAGPGPGKVAARAGTLLVVNALVLLTAATQLNAQFLFFADWTDLKGAVTGTVTTTGLRRGGSAGAAGRTVVHGRAATAAASLPPLPAGASSARPISYTVRGPASGIVGTVFVRLPPGYTAGTHTTTRYPVIETFQGYPSAPNHWLAPNNMNLPGVLDQQVAARTIGPAPYPPQSSLARRYDLVSLARRKPPPTAMWLETSHADATSYSSSAAFLKAARPPLAVDATVLG